MPAHPLTAQINLSALAIPPRGRVRVGYFWGLDALVRRSGRSPAAILEKNGLAPTLFDDPDNTMDCMAVTDLLARCSATLNDPLFGLHLAAAQEPEVFGCSIALAQSAPTFGRALQCLVDFIPVSASPECELELVAIDNGMELRWRSHVGLGDAEQTGYHGVLILFKTLRMLGRQSFRPMYATLTCGIGRAHLDTIQQCLGCRVQGNAAHNAIAFSSASLDVAMPTSNRLTFSILGQGLNQLRTTAGGDFVESVRASIRRKLSGGQCSVSDCAAALHTSTRTLQKRLNRMGIRFSDIVLNERIKLAKQALLWSDASLDEIAFQLGYAEQTSFGRAFKTVTGLTPKVFRAGGDSRH